MSEKCRCQMCQMCQYTSLKQFVWPSPVVILCRKARHKQEMCRPYDVFSGIKFTFSLSTTHSLDLWKQLETIQFLHLDTVVELS